MIGLSGNVKLTCKYAFTLTLRPILFKKEPEHQYDLTVEYIADKLNNYYNVTCIAEITKACNVHWHGVVQFLHNPATSVSKNFHSLFRNDPFIGFICLKQIDDDQKWFDYITKELASTKLALGRRPITMHTDKMTPEMLAEYSIDW